MAHDILSDILARAAQPDAGDQVTFRGADPVFPTRFRMGDLGAATIAAAALQAARIYEERTGKAQDVSIDVDAAAAAMRSWRYLRELPIAPEAPARHPVGYYRTADDRWLFLHRMAPHHYARQLEVLQCGPDDESVAAAIRRWKAHDLEQAIMAADACAAMVRTREEWAEHEQAKAVASLPLFTLTKIGESDPVPSGVGDRPLGGIRVLDVTRVLAGPTAARALAEHGAEVLRISSPTHPDTAKMIRDTGHGKRSSVVDLKTADGAATLRRLVAGADVFSQGYRPGAMAALGFSPTDLARLRPGIVSLSISAFGSAGPWRDRRGFDSIVQSMSGIAAEQAGPDGMPHTMPANPLDYSAGYLAAFLVGVALQRRAREGGSYHIELSLAQTGHYLDTLGRTDAATAQCRPADLSEARLAELTMERDTPYGRLSYLSPVARLPLTPARWELPSVPADHDSPQWRAR
jgi:crotonobetainyl-CoA:carnitine CoA-transferase CaiB-like acyl-CoA transferase